MVFLDRILGQSETLVRTYSAHSVHQCISIHMEGDRGGALKLLKESTYR
jgi:hypothetical protein